MKKLVYLIVAIVILGLIASGCFLSVVPPVEKAETSMLKKPGNGNGIDLTGYHYNLNLIGKKADWSGGGNDNNVNFNNPDRHTMFVPVDTTGLTFPVGGTEGDPFATLDGIKISMTQGTEFAVLDGNAFDDGECAFQLGLGTYRVFIVAKAKPHPDSEDLDGYYTDITGWVYCQDLNEYLFDIGKIRVSKKLSRKFEEITDLFYVSNSEEEAGGLDLIPPGGDDVWVFMYLSNLTAAGYTDAEYFWQYDNHGNKLVKVRFYPD